MLVAVAPTIGSVSSCAHARGGGGVSGNRLGKKADNPKHCSGNWGRNSKSRTVPWVVSLVKTGLGRGVYSSFSSGSSVLLEILKGWTRRRYGVARYNLISMF